MNRPGDYNTVHDHPDCHMSGAYYVKLPEGDSGTFRMYNPMYSYNYNSDGYNPPYKQPRVEIKGKEGALIIFRAPLLHDVTRNNTKEDRISLTDFRKRVSLAVIDDTVEDNAQVMAAVHKVKQFYKQWADRIQESKIMERGVERNINFLKERLASVKVNGKILTYQQWKEYKGKGLQTTIRIRDKDYKVAQILKIIDEQEQYFKALKKNVARKNYLNIFVKRDRINADEAAFDAYAFKSIKKSHGDLSDDEIFQIIENLKGEQAWEQIRRTEVNLKKNYDDYNLDIVLNPVGLSGHLKARKLNLDYAQWMRDGWIEDDIMALMQVYNRSVGPDVHLAQVFGDQTMWGGHFGKNIGIGEVIAEYKFKFRKARGDKKKQKAITGSLQEKDMTVDCSMRQMKG